VFLNETTGQGRTDSAHGNVDSLRSEDAHQAFGSKRYGRECIVVANRGYDRVAVREICEPNCSMGAGTLQYVRAFWVPVPNEDLMAIGDQIGREGLPHVSESHHANAAVDESRLPLPFR
jgi:hypothetical protein